LRKIDFLLKKFPDRFDCIAFVGTSYFLLLIDGLVHIAMNLK